MPITTLDPNTALVLIDLQKGILAMAAGRPIGPVIANAVLLADAFRARKLPVVLVNVAGVAPGRTETPRFAGVFPPIRFAELPVIRMPSSPFPAAVAAPGG